MPAARAERSTPDTPDLPFECLTCPLRPLSDVERLRDAVPIPDRSDQGNEMNLQNDLGFTYYC